MRLCLMSSPAPTNETAMSFGRSSRSWERSASFKSDATLEELRLSRRISDGGSIHIGESTKALLFSEQRRRSFHLKTKDDAHETDDAKTTNDPPKIPKQHSETYITCLMEDMRNALRELGANEHSHSQLEAWTILVHECLSSNTRNFHSIHHVFEICAACDPVQMLAAAFRDTVNLRTDDHGEVFGRLEPLKGILDDKLEVLNEPAEDDTSLKLVIDVFDVKPGQNLASWHGINMFLSSILFVRTFESTLSLKVLAQVVAAIEATIPFRREDEHGMSALDHLYERLSCVNSQYELNLSEDQRIHAVQRAADLANRNLGNFASSDATIFLDHTWSLLPEQSKALRQSFLYTVLDFLYATKDMTDFLVNLTPSIIFQSFRGVPSKQEMESFTSQTEENLRKGLIYLHANLVGVAVLASFCVLTGGDGPMSYFAGDLPTPDKKTYRLAEGFCDGHVEDDSGLDYDEDVYEILVHGRSVDQSFDTRNSPLAAYVYCKLGDDGLRSAVKLVTYPMTEGSATKLLKSLPKEMLKKLGNEIGELAISRAQRIEELLTNELLQ